MTDSNTTPDELASLSEVTPPKRHYRLKSFNRYTLSIGLVLVMLIYCCIPEPSKAREAVEESPSQLKELTLSENLALLDEMKKKQVEEVNKQPLQRVPNPSMSPFKPRNAKPKLSKELLARMNAPTTFLMNTPATSSLIAGESGSHEANASVLTNNNPDAQFINQQEDIVAVSAHRLPHPAFTIPAGEMITATLETAIHSELPGMVRAITTRDSYSLQGQHCLIPRGSQLVGQFNAAVVEGQSRVFIVWNRVQLANGVIVSLTSPSTDAIGRSGQGADAINRHFFERFSISALLSILGGYTAMSGVNGQDDYNSKSQYRMSLASSFQQASNQTLQANANLKPMLLIYQGTEINVFVAHDLDFYKVRGLSRKM